MGFYWHSVTAKFHENPSFDLQVEICALVEFYAASSGIFLPTFLDNASVPSSRVKQPKKNLPKRRL